MAILVNSQRAPCGKELRSYLFYILTMALWVFLFNQWVWVWGLVHTWKLGDRLPLSIITAVISLCSPIFDLLWLSQAISSLKVHLSYSWGQHCPVDQRALVTIQALCPLCLWGFSGPVWPLLLQNLCVSIDSAHGNISSASTEFLLLVHPLLFQEGRVFWALLGKTVRWWVLMQQVHFISFTSLSLNRERGLHKNSSSRLVFLLSPTPMPHPWDLLPYVFPISYQYISARTVAFL